MSNIKIKNLKFSYDKEPVFKNLNFVLKKDKTLSIIGGTASGKTTLLKILDGQLEFDGEVLINNKAISKENNIVVIFSASEFTEKIVKDELQYEMNLAQISNSKIEKKFDELNDFFNINRILNKRIEDLEKNDKTLVKIISKVLLKPKYIALDNLLINLNTRTKILLLNYLNSNDILLINVTSNMEEVLYTDYVLCLYDGISAIDGKTIEVLKQEKILKRLGFSLPFMVDLSIQLKLYGLIKKMCLNKEAMVKQLWK